MLVTLTDSEIRAALSKAAHEKISHVHQAGEDAGYFVVRANGGEVEDVDDVKFVVDFGER